MKDFANIDLKEKSALEKAKAPCSTTKAKTFVKALLSEGNKWNLKFFLTSVVSCGVAEFLANMIAPSMALVITVLTLVIALIVAAKINPVNFINDGCALSQDTYKSKVSGRTFKTESFLPGFALLFLAAWVFVSTFIHFSMKVLTLPLGLVVTHSVAWFLFVPTIYCILKNLPVTIYLKKDSWKSKSMGTNAAYDHTHQRHSGYNPFESHRMHQGHSGPESISSTRNLISHPANSWYQGNISHKK